MYVPGDILLVNDYSGQGDLIGNLIRAGEQSRYGNVPAARWTHSALIVSESGDLVEALKEGIRHTNISKYHNHDTKIISPEWVSAGDERRRFACRFALKQVGTDYDVLDFAMLAGSLLTGLDLSLHADHAYICSGLVSRATECYTVAGYPYPAEQMMPADIDVYFGAFADGPLPIYKRWLLLVQALRLKLL